MMKKKSTTGDQSAIEIATLKQGWQRTLADFDNYRKRTEVDKKLWAQDAVVDIALQLLPVIDNFDMAGTHISEVQAKDPVVQGLLHVRTQLNEILSNNNITKIPINPGDTFNPALHEAVDSIGGAGGQIVAEIRLAGYQINDKIIRPAKVVVRNG